MSNLAKRLATAGVLVPILLAALFVDPTVYSILACSVLALGIAYDEFLRMALPVSDEDRVGSVRAVSIVVAGAMIIVTTLEGPGRVLAPSLTAAAIASAAAILFRKRTLDQAGRHLAAALGGLLYVPLLGVVWPLLKHEYGAAWLFLTLAVAFGSDTAAYFVGRAIGKHKLYPEVSPKKTVEGAVGGLLGGAACMAGLGSLWLTPEVPLAHGIALGVGGSVLGQIGDLVASMTKRTYGVKDSGNVLPGHGGLLDRVDALLFVAPLIYYYANLRGL